MSIKDIEAREKVAPLTEEELGAIRRALGTLSGMASVQVVEQTIRDLLDTVDDLLAQLKARDEKLEAVKEQAREALKQARCELYGIEPMKPYCTIAQCDAALAALEVKS